MSKVCYINTRRPPPLDAPDSEIAAFAHKLVEAGFAAYQNGQHEASLDLLQKAREQWRRCTKWPITRQPLEILIAAVRQRIDELADKDTLQ